MTRFLFTARSIWSTSSTLVVTRTMAETPKSRQDELECRTGARPPFELRRRPEGADARLG